MTVTTGKATPALDLEEVGEIEGSWRRVKSHVLCQAGF